MSDKELDLELLGVHGLSPFTAYNSSSRNYMFSSHLAQRLITCDPDSKRVITGLENKFSKYTFDIKMPKDGKILKVMQRYPSSIDASGLKYNPETIVIYEDNETKTIDDKIPIIAITTNISIKVKPLFFFILILIFKKIIINYNRPINYLIILNKHE